MKYLAVLFLSVSVLTSGLVSGAGIAVAADMSSLQQQSQQEYFSALPDVPLMSGMDEVEDQTFVFDKAEGRVIETAGFLAKDPQIDPQTYYSDVLGQLGWKPLKSGLFARGNEQLVVIVRKVQGGTLVKFYLTPLSR